MNDSESIKQVLSGDTSAFASLVERHKDSIYRFCLSYLKNPAEAEDAAQETFLKAFRSLARFRGDSSFSTWLHRIAANECLDLLRKSARQKQDSLDALLEAAGEGAVIPPINEGTDQENKDLVERALAELPADSRTALILREIQGFSYAEIAEVLHCSLDAVKARLYRSRQELEVILRHFLSPRNVK